MSVQTRTPDDAARPAPPHPDVGSDDLGRERWELLRQLDALLDAPMVALSFVWLGLTILDFTVGLGQTLNAVTYVIWALFAVQFLIGVILAPSKRVYLRRNWLTALALVLPAFRMLRAVRAFRLLRAARAARSVTLLRLFTTLNRGMRAVNRVIAHRGIGYVLLLTIMVTFGGAAGMAQFESPAALREPGAGLTGYGEALWWTAMTMTTMGSDYFPRTLEGRVLGWLLALYAFTVFGYITATIASLFLARDAAASAEQARATPEVVTAGSSREVGARMHPGEELTALRQEVRALRGQVAALSAALTPASASLAATGGNDARWTRPADRSAETSSEGGAPGATPPAPTPAGADRRGSRER